MKEILKKFPKEKKDLELIKVQISKKLKIPPPNNFKLLQVYQELIKKKRLKKDKRLIELLKKRPIRSLSGIVNVSVVTKPYPCPGQCLFCPTEKGLPKSYLSGEPAIERAKEVDFDPYLQVKSRLKTLQTAGHLTNKVELRVIGGTWSFYPLSYREWFIKRCFDGANGRDSKNLKEAQKLNERAQNRIVGISIETRADFINEEEIKELRKLGVTLVEIGVQNIFEDILEKNKTNLSPKIISLATQLLKDAGFKVLYHLMPNLPGSSFNKDFLSFKTIFEDENFKPDWIKIYPVAILPNTPLYHLWKDKKYRPYSEKKLIELLVKVKSIVPHWIRITRIARDIPSNRIVAGCKISNLRELVQKEMKKKKMKCHCIRCREVREEYDPNEKVYLFKEEYDASGGKEFFLSFETKNREKLYSFLRLRIPSQVFSGQKHFLRVLEKSAIIREIQTFGETMPFGKRGIAPQHRGLGKKLIKEAEKIAKKNFGLNNIAVIAGVGAREYFRKLGYRLKETYMIKKL